MSTSAPPPGTPGPVLSEPSLPSPSRGARAGLLASVVAAAALAGLAFLVLGGSANRVIDPVAQAATASSSAPGYQMHLSIDVTSSASSTPITAVGDGTFDVQHRAGTMSLSMNLGNDPQVVQALGSNSVTIQEIVNGTTIYVKMPAAAARALPLAGKEWISIDLAKLTGIPGLSSLLGDNPVSTNPSEMLQYLRAASDSVVAVGHERVNGLPTTHYRAQLSLDRAANAVPSGERAAARQALSKIELLTHIHQIPVDVWVDAQHLVRRTDMTLAMSPSGGPTLSERLTMDITHYGPEPRPALPPANEVANLSGLLGAGG